MFIGTVPGIHGAHTQGATHKLNRNLKEVLALCLEEMDSDTIAEIPDFVGIQEVEVGKWADLG